MKFCTGNTRCPHTWPGCTQCHRLSIQVHGSHNTPAMREDNALFSIRPSGPRLRQPQEYGGGKLHSNEPTALRYYQVSSECLFGLKSRFSLCVSYASLDSFSLSLNLVQYYKNKLETCPYVRVMALAKNNFFSLILNALNIHWASNPQEGGRMVYITQMAMDWNKTHPMSSSKFWILSRSGLPTHPGSLLTIALMLTHCHQHTFGPFYWIDQQEKGRNY
jgi:hypothetical protein